MTRSKKSRKPGVGSSGARKSDDEKLISLKDKRIRKKNGNSPGTRQTIANQNKQSTDSTQAKDPRLGSKKLIDLGKPVDKVALKKPKVAAVAEIAKVRPVNQEPDLYQELQAIEDDALLQEILQKQDAEQELTEAEVDHFNTLMERHEVIRDKLGLTDEDEEDEIVDKKQSLSEDDLWEKFNSTEFNEKDDF
ncbi:MAG: Der GTPase-activating protein YihI [Thalassotalea sp.]